MRRKKGKQSAGCGSKALRAALERQRWTNARDDLARHHTNLIKPPPPRPTPTVKELLTLIPRAPPRPPRPAAAACTPAVAADVAAEGVPSLGRLCAAVVGETLDRYEYASARGAFALLPGALVEAVAAAASRKRLVDDANVGLLANSAVETLALAGDVGDAALSRVLPRRRTAADDSCGDEWGARCVFDGCVHLRELSICSPSVTADFVKRVAFALPTLECLRLGSTALRAPGQGCRALVGALPGLTALRILDLADVEWADEATLSRVLAPRARPLPEDKDDLFGVDDDGPSAPPPATTRLEIRCRVAPSAARRLTASHSNVVVVSTLQPADS